MAFVWHEFGLLAEVSMDDRYVYIKNTNNSTLKMSKGKYKGSALIVYDKAQTLVGSTIIVRTSQNTSDWSTEVWFSEIEEVHN